jgi:hypothetical protein
MANSSSDDDDRTMATLVMAMRMRWYREIKNYQLAKPVSSVFTDSEAKRFVRSELVGRIPLMHRGDILTTAEV